MSSINHLRQQKKYFQAVSQILNSEIKNVNIKKTTVVDVQLSRDHSNLKVYVTFESSNLKSLHNLNNAKQFVRRKLASYLNSYRIVPEVEFIIDEATKNGRRIDEIIDSWKK